MEVTPTTVDITRENVSTALSANFVLGCVKHDWIRDCPADDAVTTNYVALVDESGNFLREVRKKRPLMIN